MNGWYPVVAAVFSSGSVAAVVGYWRDRKRNSADGYVASETRELRVGAERFADLERRMEFMSEAFDAERGSKDRLIAELTADNRRLHDELASKDGELAALREEIKHLQDQLTSMAERVDRALPPDAPA